MKVIIIITTPDFTHHGPEHFITDDFDNLNDARTWAINHKHHGDEEEVEEFENMVQMGEINVKVVDVSF